jgi:tRNA threonylcarbamoyladenosine biosynthesis protein TsaB
MVLFAEIEVLLGRHGLGIRDIDLFAAASGPGSFTGVRVGLSAMKGLAEVLGRKIVAVSNLEALAEFGRSEARAPVIDAHRGEVYSALYGATGNLIVPEVVLPFEKFLDVLPERDVEWISKDFEPFRPWLAGTRFENSRVVTAPAALAGAIARIAIRGNAAGLAKHPAAIEANYVRKSDAELLWKTR